MTGEPMHIEVTDGAKIEQHSKMEKRPWQPFAAEIPVLGGAAALAHGGEPFVLDESKHGHRGNRGPMPGHSGEHRGKVKRIKQMDRRVKAKERQGENTRLLRQRPLHAGKVSTKKAPETSGA